LAEAEDKDLLVTKHPQSPATEAIRHAHTAIMLSASGRPPGVIMVTSANPSEGKTMVASNLALTFALDRHQTVVIDCDLRKPRLHKIFQLDPQPGLSNYLTGSATLEEILRPASVPNLSVITAGARPPNPGNLLNSEEFKDLLTQLRQRFDHIIIDTPPILGFSDGLIVSVLTDGVLFITKHNSTHKGAGRLACQLLSQIHAPLMGAVLNCVDAHGQAYGRYNYHYNYKHYSKYYDGKVGKS
jgi:capsular exopolysaccharide synthesis family protein